MSDDENTDEPTETPPNTEAQDETASIAETAIETSNEAVEIAVDTAISVDERIAALEARIIELESRTYNDERTDSEPSGDSDDTGSGLGFGGNDDETPETPHESRDDSRPAIKHWFYGTR